jgi:hypothetical protein
VVIDAAMSLSDRHWRDGRLDTFTPLIDQVTDLINALPDRDGTRHRIAVGSTQYMFIPWADADSTDSRFRPRLSGMRVTGRPDGPSSAAVSISLVALMPTPSTTNR